MNRRKISAGLVAGALALFGLGAGTAQAVPPDPAPPAPAPSSSFLLPLAVPLTVDVTTGAGGAITDVSVNPAEPITVTKDRPRKVSFTVDATGVKVSVKSKGQTQSVSARGGSLSDLVGAAGWTGDLWGDGSSTTVGFTVGGTDDAPTLTIDNPGGGTPEGPTPFSDDDGEEVGVKASITFTSPDGAMSRTLSIKVKVENEDDDDDDSGETHASVKITLGKLRGLPQEAAAVVGVDQTWSGLLCDGTTGTIVFRVDADGNIDVTGGAPTADRVKEDGRKAEVRLPGGERIKIRASVNDAGQITINFQEKIRCRDAQNPTVNGQPVTSVDDDDDHDDDHDGDHHRGGDDNGGRRGGGGDHDSDD